MPAFGKDGPDIATACRLYTDARLVRQHLLGGFLNLVPPIARDHDHSDLVGEHHIAVADRHSAHRDRAGRVRRGNRIVAVTGEAWLDREWSSDYLTPTAQGWDWTGLNFDDGSALMAFRIRRKGGGTLWAGGALRGPDGTTTALGPRDVTFRPLATWRSGATGAVYPVSQEVSIRVGGRVVRWRLTPMFAAQELDARRGGLPVYWEGAVRTKGGRGYLELTGYDRALRM